MWRIAIQIRTSAQDEAICLSSAFRHSETRPWKLRLGWYNIAGNREIIWALTLFLFSEQLTSSLMF